MNQEEFPRKHQSSPPETAQTAKAYMSDQEFTARMAALIPTPSEKGDSSLLALADELWLGMKEDLFHTFSFIAHHFASETLQNVYDLCGTREQGLLPWELMGAAIYMQAGTHPKEIGRAEWDHFVILPTIEAPDTVSSLAVYTVHEHQRATRFYTLHFGQFDPLELLHKAMARAARRGVTVTEAMQEIDYDMDTGHVAANKALSGPESLMAEQLTTLMASSPITAAHINIDVDSGAVVTEMNPLWEHLRDELEPRPPVQRQKRDGKKQSSKHRKQPER